MREYIAFYKGQQKTVQATSSYAAQLLAAGFFGARKSWQVTVVLADVEVDTAAL